jgi:hypothetical protein
MLIALPQLLSTSLLADLRTYDVRDAKLTAGDDSELSNLAARSVATGTAELLPAPPEGNTAQWIGSAMAIPIYRAGEVVSVVVLAIQPKSAGAGVLELWDPVAPYEEVKLRCGYFAHLERFANVSSFVRFERGSGLPGQVWDRAMGVIHDRLPDHPGFLRAAGASAGLLQTAIGIPIINTTLRSVAVLISSAATPIAKGYEVWTHGNDGFTLESSAYQNMPASLRLLPETKLPNGNGLPALACEHGGALTTEDPSYLSSARDGDVSDIAGGLAIPFYQNNTLTSVTTLLF